MGLSMQQSLVGTAGSRQYQVFGDAKPLVMLAE
jgi:hypothetical protein